MTCARCYGSGRVYDGARPGSSPCPRCEPESAEADGAPTCRICGRVVIRHPGVRGLVCLRCDGTDRREHTRVARAALKEAPIDWTAPVEGWRLW